jgi:hypothetical protein
MCNKKNEQLCTSCESTDINNVCDDCIELCNYCNLFFCAHCDELEYISSTGLEEDFENDFDRMFCIKCIQNHYVELAPWDNL